MVKFKGKEIKCCSSAKGWSVLGKTVPSGSFALWALKFKFFVGRLIANKHLSVIDNCQKLKQKRYRKKQDESIHTWKTKGDQTKTKNKKQTKKEKAKGN